MYTKENNKTNKYLITREDLFCEFCGKQCKNSNSYTQHKIRCKNNPNRINLTNIINNIPLERRGWSKGLTKKTDSRVANVSRGVKNSTKRENPGRANTEEKEKLRREKISKTMRNNPLSGGKRDGSGKGKKGWYKGYFCDSTYELVYVIYNIDHKIKFERCNLSYPYIYDGRNHLYYPDFILEDGSLIEIKGYHTPLVEVKISSVVDRPISVLYKKDLSYAFDYVKNTYKYKKLEDLYD